MGGASLEAETPLGLSLEDCKTLVEAEATEATAGGETTAEAEAVGAEATAAAGTAVLVVLI